MTTNSLQSFVTSFSNSNFPKESAKLNGEQINLTERGVRLFLNETFYQTDLGPLPSKQWLEKFVKQIPLEKLEKAVLIDHPEALSALETAKNLFREAQYYLETTEDTAPSIRARLNAILDSLLSILESILNAFGVADFFKPAESQVHAEFKGQKIMLLISLFTMLTGILVPVIGPALCGTILGGTLLSIAALSLVYPYFRPAANFLPQGENWTKQCQKGHLGAADGRKESLDEIAQTLIASKNTKTHVMLLGKTGVGKTATAKAFVQAVERGDYPELKGKKIFYFNTADLVNASEMFSNGNKILTRISQAMGSHREKFILIFDEIHLACQKKEKSDIGEQLKTYLDNGKDNFPFCIGITTEEEYYRDIYVNNAAFARRFKRIAIQNTDDAETARILNRFLLKKAPKAILEPNAAQTLLKKTKEAFGEQAAQPASSLKILAQCIKRISESQKSPLDTKVEQVKSRIQTIYAARAVDLRAALQKNDELPELEERLQALQEELTREKAAIENLFRMRDQMAETKASLFQTALEISKFSKDALSSNDKKKLSRMLLQTHYLLPALEKAVLSEAARLKVQIAIDSPLIDRVIQEELESERKAKEMILAGKEQLANRSA